MNLSSYIVLLSGGLDSVVNLYLAHKEGLVKKALTFNYGQRSFEREHQAASYFCSQLKIDHETIELNWLSKITTTSLVNTQSEIPNLANLDDLTAARETAKAVWVPNRNGLFLNIAACYAEALGVEFVIPGFNAEEAVTFPDNSPAFIEATNSSLRLSTLSQVKVACFTTSFDKTKMVKAALDLKINLSQLWSCYKNEETPCGICESCKRSKRAFEANKLKWPWL